MFKTPDPGGAPAAPAGPSPPASNPPPPASPGNSSSSGTPGHTETPPFPGIAGVLAGDPNYQQLLAFDTAASGQDLATMNANIATMQGYYGSDSNPLSILGRIYQGLQDRNRTIANTLTGHGMINSGETGFQGARATLAYQQQEYDAQFKLQQYISGLQQAFASAQRAQKFNEMQESWAAVKSWLDMNKPQYVPGTSGDGGDTGGDPAGTTNAPGTAPDFSGMIASAQQAVDPFGTVPWKGLAGMTGF